MSNNNIYFGFQMDSAQWEIISDSAKDLVKQMLTVDPAQRITIQEVLSHRWIRVRAKHMQCCK